MFGKLNILKFEGFNETVAAELIKDGEARDIVNMRMEHMGKLNTRNGYIYGAVVENVGDSHGGVYIGDLEVNHTPTTYLANCGILGIGELKLSNKWEAFDTDKFMVYVIRSLDADDYQPELNQPNYQPQYKTQAYLMAPLTGKYRNKILYYNPNWVATAYTAGYETNSIDILSQADVLPKGSRETLEQLYAPNRILPDYIDLDYASLPSKVVKTTPTIKEDGWNDQYVQMNQYRNKLVVSDKINGDKILENEYDISDAKTELGEKINRFHLRPNALETFDVGYVNLQMRNGTGEENGDGVENGMALYKYVLPKKTMKVSRDNYKGTIGGKDVIPKEQTANWAEQFFSEMESKVAGKDFDTLFSLFMFEDWAHVATVNELDGKTALEAKADYDTGMNLDSKGYKILSHCGINKTEEFIFTNAETAAEYDDALGKVELKKEEYKNTDGILEYDIAPDVFIWDDFVRKYYQCSGSKKLDPFTPFLTDIDRFFTKLQPGLPRVTKLIAKTEQGKQVPLGVWKYRFVWDFGDGEYSAPSADMCAPDAIWSILADAELTDASGNYTRPKKYTETELKQTALPQLEPYNHDWCPIEIYTPQIFLPVMSGGVPTGQYTLTDFGRQFAELKYKLYEGLDHRFGITADTANSLENVYSGIYGLTDPIKIGNIGVQSTAFFSSSNLTLKGTIWEGAAIYFYAGDRTKKWKDSQRNEAKPFSSLNEYALNSVGRLVIPIFKTSSKPETHNSLFDSEGRLRATWLWEGDSTKNFNIIQEVGNPITGSFSVLLNGNPSYSQQIAPRKTVFVFPGVNCGIGTSTYLIGMDRRIMHESLGLYIGPNDIFLKQYLLPPSAWDNVTGAGTMGRIVLEFGYWYNQYDVLTADANAKDPNIYLNFLSKYDVDENNIDDTTLDPFRPHTIFRGITKEVDKLDWVNENVPPQVVDRLVLNGIAGIEVLSNGDKSTIDSSELFDISFGIRGEMGGTHSPDLRQSRMYDDDEGADVTINKFDLLQQGPTQGYNDWTPDKGIVRDRRLRSGITNYCTVDTYTYCANIFSIDHTTHIDNVEATIYGEAQRLIATEQLTSYFPSSLLFNAPRLGLRMINPYVPKRAKKLLIFRTKCSHANDFSPNDYGLVQSIDIRRKTVEDDAINPGLLTSVDVGEAITQLSDGTYLSGLYFFDKVKDSELDFSYNLSDYDGFRTALKSRFNKTLYESVFYANLKETWQPLPSHKEWAQVLQDGTNIYSNDYVVFETTDGFKENEEYEIRYKLVLEDVLGNSSPSTELSTISVTVGTAGKKKTVVLYKLPSQYSNYISKLKIYRAIESPGFSSTRTYKDAIFDDPNNPTAKIGYYYYLVGEIVGTSTTGELQYNEGIFVDNNNLRGARLVEPEPKVTDYKSGVRKSEAFKPDHLKTENIWEFGSGQIDEITGLEILYGNLIVFKENSIYRARVTQDAPFITDQDKIAEIGCIAPHTLINVSNVLYFLTWQGFYSYDNNRFSPLSELFDEELKYVMEVNKEKMHEATCGYNATYNEIYLNVPAILGTHEQYGQNREVHGNVYVMNLTKGYAGKFEYPKDVKKVEGGPQVTFVADGLQMTRLYYTNSLGELRSADIVPIKHLLLAQ